MPTGIVAALGAVACLALLWRRDLKRQKAQRAHLFAACLDLFQSYRVIQEGLGYPVLSGRYRGHDVRLEPVCDHMAWRKLPVLWLKVTILEPIPYQGVLDLLLRPLGSEYYSPNADLEHHLPLPKDWPQDAILATDDPAALPSLDLIAPHLELLADPKLKELLITPKGVRLVARVWQASRVHYATFREIRFDGVELDPALAQLLLDAAIAIASSLSEPRPMRQVA